MLRILAGLLAALASTLALAAVPASYLSQSEASMLLTGRIQIDTEGRVTRFSLDQKDLPAEAKALVDRVAPHWRFEPVLREGRPIHAATDMTLRLVANKLDDGTYELRVRSADFRERPERTPSQHARMRPPSYPQRAVEARIAGTVYLLLKTTPDGKVLDAIAEQVNLATVTGGRSMERWRGILAEASLDRAREWQLGTLPLVPGHDFALARVPVQFSLGPDRSPDDRYGRWEVYNPGPRQRNPWSEEPDSTFSPDLLLPGQTYAAEPGWTLRNDLEERPET